MGINLYVYIHVYSQEKKLKQSGFTFYVIFI